MHRRHKNAYDNDRLIKEAILLSARGYLQVHAFASIAQIPLEDVAVAVTDSGGSAIALRLTNRSGELDDPIIIETQDLYTSQSPDTGVIPYITVNLYARLRDYEETYIENIQIFPDTTTTQNLEMIPLSEFPGSYNLAERFNTLPQNL